MTGGDFHVSRARLRELGNRYPRLRELRGAEIVLGSSVRAIDPHNPRHAKGNLTAAATSAKAGVPHLYMVDNTSHPQAFSGLAEAGAIVVPFNHVTEGGPLRPYMLAARIINHYAGDGSLFVMLEGDHDLTANPQNIVALLKAANQLDVITGARSLTTMLTMAPYRQMVEGVLATAVQIIAGVPFDVASGILALTSRGREVFYEFDGTDRSYLIHTPHDAGTAGVPFGGVELEFIYHPSAVNTELKREQDKMRRSQLSHMLNEAVLAAGGARQLNAAQHQAHHAALAVLNGLESQARSDY